MKKIIITKRKQARKELLKDLILIAIGAILAFALVKIGIIAWLLDVLGESRITSFFVGIFFTSVFTVTPSAVALANINAPAMTVAFFGALGAMCGDFILFFFIRDHFAYDLLNSLKPSFVKRLFRSFHFGFLKWLSPFLGALIIASPLPDEFGLILMGLSKTKTAILLPVSFLMNFLGITLILWFSQFV